MTCQLSQGGLTNESFDKQGHFPGDILTVAQWAYSKKRVFLEFPAAYLWSTCQCHVILWLKFEAVSRPLFCWLL